MSRPARNRRRIKPYAWLGAGAVTVGLGAATLGGAAVAFADTGTDTGAAVAASGNAATGSEPASQAAPKPKNSAIRGVRGSVSPPDTGALADTAVAGSPVVLLSRLPVPAAVVPSLDAASVVPSTPQASTARRGLPAAATQIEVPTAALTAALPPGTSGSAAPDTGPDTSLAPAAAVPAPAANPAPNMESWLPVTPIVPGAHVQLALQEMTQARTVIQAQTWGSGNILAGLAAIVPQLFLGGAALSLGAWQSTNPGAQQLLAVTAGIPIVRLISRATLVVDTWLTDIAELSLGGAGFFLPLVGFLGAPGAVAAAQPLIAAARQDGLVYAVVPLRVVAGTEPVARVSINNGSRVPLLVDTGASGVVVVPGAVPNLNTLTPVSSGNSCFSGGICYHYETYQVPVDFGGGAATGSALVNVVTNNNQYPNSVADFTDFFSWGADGIMGVGANTAGPGPAPIPNTTLPGELSSGLLIFQPLLPLGLGGVLVFGLNPLPTRVSLPGAPDAYVKVSVNGGPKTDAGAIIDSGGVFGTLPLANAPAGSVVGDPVAPGTTISVYSADGATLLYTYRAQDEPRTTPVIDSGLMNTGNAPYARYPIYLNYAGPGSGIGSTDFSIW